MNGITASFLLLLLAGFSSSSSPDVQNIYPCGELGKLTRFQVVPGNGWDNLRNIEMNAVFQPNYTSCVVSMDGRFFLPLNAHLLPKGQSSVEIFSEFFDHYNKYKSMTASSINVAAMGSFAEGISGSFSEEHQHTRVSLLETKSVTTRASVRQALYTVLKSPEMPLSDSFLQRLKEIGYQLSQNETDMAMYLSDMVVADYGTHYISRVDAGGILWKQDTIQVASRSLSTKDVTSIKASASVSFGAVFNFSAGWSKDVSYESLNGYMSNQTDSTIHSVGGPPVHPSLTVDDWVTDLYKNLVPVDRAGDPIYYAVNPRNINSMTHRMISDVRRNLKEAVKRYYSANTVKGCMVQGASNFNPLANVPHGDCSSRKFNFTFGGVYQTCQGDALLCRGHNIGNIITGGASCPSDYTEVHLHSQQFAVRKQCESYWIFWTKCRQYYATYSIYWCAAKRHDISQETGYLFGGLYSPRTDNPSTRKSNCPPSFLPFNLGAGDFVLCLSRDFTSQTQNAQSFGGFFSCISGNPYTVMPSKRNVSMKGSASGSSTLMRYYYEGGPKEWPHACPKGFSQHLADVDGNCEIMFCSTTTEWKEFHAIQVNPPPFVQLPEGFLAVPMPPNTNLMFASVAPSPSPENVDNPLHGTVVSLGVCLALACVVALIGPLLAWWKMRRPGVPERFMMGFSNPAVVPADPVPE